LLAQPERLAEEYRRRLHPDSPTTHTTLTTLEAQLGKLQQGLARLIDSYTDALIEKHEFEPRITRLRQRIAHVEAQRQQLAEEAARHTGLRLIIGRLEDFAAQVQEALVEADWSRKRELIRALVKRVGVAHDQVYVVFRIDPCPGDSSPEKKSLQDCRRSNDATLRCSELCVSEGPLFHHSGAKEFPDQLKPTLSSCFARKNCLSFPDGLAPSMCFRGGFSNGKSSGGTPRPLRRNRFSHQRLRIS
jgi:hypothetical protein